MAKVLVRNLDEGVVRRLKDQACHHGRSLEGELRTILEEVANVTPLAYRERLRRFRQEHFGGRVLESSAEMIHEDRER